jgi:hypothetical protein
LRRFRLPIPSHRRPDNQLNIFRRPERHQRIVRPVKYLYRKAFLFFPVCLLVRCGAELPVRELAVKR